MDCEKLTGPQLYTMNYRQLKNIGHGRNSLQGRTHRLVIQSQRVSPKNVHTGNIIKTEQVRVRIYPLYISKYIV